MSIKRNHPVEDAFNIEAGLSYSLRLDDFKIAMQDVYDFFFDVNKLLISKGLDRLEQMLRPAIMSGLLSDMLTASIAKHSRVLTQNLYHNGHPDLIVKNVYPRNEVKAGEKGIEIKTTRHKGGNVDTHGARKQCLCVFVYEVDEDTEPAIDRRPLTFTEVYLAEVDIADFRRNERGPLGTRTASLDRDGIAKLRRNWIYRLERTSN